MCLPPALSHTLPLSLSLAASSLLLASPKINLTSEGHSLRCLLNVFLLLLAPCFSLSLSLCCILVLSCVNMCAVSAFLLSWPTALLLKPSSQTLRDSWLTAFCCLKRRAERRCSGLKKDLRENKCVLCTSASVFTPQLDVQNI